MLTILAAFHTRRFPYSILTTLTINYTRYSPYLAVLTIPHRLPTTDFTV
jgi:hypothetical protein